MTSTTEILFAGDFKAGDRVEITNRFNIVGDDAPYAGVVVEVRENEGGAPFLFPLAVSYTGHKGEQREGSFRASDIRHAG